MSHTNRIGHLIPFEPKQSARPDEDQDEDEDEDETATYEDPDTDTAEDAEPADDDDTDVVGDGGDGDDDDDGDDGDDDDGDDYTESDHLRSKMAVAVDPDTALVSGRMIVHEDPNNANKIIVIMHLDKPIEGFDSPIPAKLDGKEMWDVETLISFDGKGYTGPTKKVAHWDKLQQVFHSKNWERDRNKKKPK